MFYPIACIDGPKAGKVIYQGDLRDFVVAERTEALDFCALASSSPVAAPSYRRRGYTVWQIDSVRHVTPTHTYRVRVYLASCDQVELDISKTLPVSHAKPVLFCERKPKPNILTDFEGWLRYVLFDHQCRWDRATALSLADHEVNGLHRVRGAFEQLTGRSVGLDEIGELPF